MNPHSVFGAPLLRPETQSELRLVRLLFARLSLTVLAFGIAIGLDGLGSELAPSARQGLYLTVAAAFASTVVSAVLLGRARSAARFAAMQIATDVGIVTSLVHFSGGRESVFAFLYVVVTLYGAVLFERRGAMVAATLSALAYGAVLFAGPLGLLPRTPSASGDLPLPVLLAIWGVHVGALYLVGVLASLLSSELQRAGLALDQSAQDLRQLSSLHRQTVESINSGLLTTDSAGCVTSFNPEAERITGLSGYEACGRHLEDVIPDSGGIVLEGLGQDRAPSTPRARLSYKNRTGKQLALGLAASVLKDEDGEPFGAVVIFQDVTAVVAMEAELRRSERLAAVGEMAAKIAHEIRNPLASISGSIQMLQGDEGGRDGSEEGRALMDIVVRETDRLNDLITDFLQYSRPSPPTLKPLCVRDELDSLAKLLEASVGEGTRIEVRGDRCHGALADPDQLKQMLWNLASNGLQAMPDGGLLVLSVDGPAAQPPQAEVPVHRNDESRAGRGPAGRRFAAISIADSGTGIPPGVQERIFEPFFTTKREGTGLGLATVHRIVESHGGSLTMSSEEGRGTTFCVQLPMPGEEAAL